MSALISVIVPVYNTEKYLKQCIDSILGQTYADFELLLVDDGSADRSPEICDDYVKIDPRVKVWHRENSGVSSSRNFGLERAKGSWISFVDSDDLLDKFMYQKLVELAERTGADTVCCGIWNGTETERKVNACWKQISGDECIYCKEEALGKILAQSASLFNKLLNAKAAKQVSFDSEIRYGEDMLYLSKYLLLAGQVAVTKTPYYLYRNQREGNVVSAKLDTRQLDFLEATKQVDVILCNHSEQYAATERCANTLLRVLHLIPLRNFRAYSEYITKAKETARLPKPINGSESSGWRGKTDFRHIAKRVLLFLARNFPRLAVLYSKALFRVIN